MPDNKNLIIGSDHGAYALKEAVKSYLKDKGFQIDDQGCYSEESCDYPVFGTKVCEKVAEGKGRGILLCGTGIGMSIVANRNRKIRAALCLNEYMARMSRMHNDANVLILGARVLGIGLAIDIVDVWLNTEFEGGRHQRRLDMIDK